jgi:hypothetical protein
MQWILPARMVSVSSYRMILSIKPPGWSRKTPNFILTNILMLKRMAIYLSLLYAYILYLTSQVLEPELMLLARMRPFHLESKMCVALSEFSAPTAISPVNGSEKTGLSTKRNKEEDTFILLARDHVQGFAPATAYKYARVKWPYRTCNST